MYNIRSLLLRFTKLIFLFMLIIFFPFPFVAAVTYVDSSAVQALKDLYHEYKARDIQVESPPSRCSMKFKYFSYL